MRSVKIVLSWHESVPLISPYTPCILLGQQLFTSSCEGQSKHRYQPVTWSQLFCIHYTSCKGKGIGTVPQYSQTLLIWILCLHHKILYSSITGRRRMACGFCCASVNFYNRFCWYMWMNVYETSTHDVYRPRIENLEEIFWVSTPTKKLRPKNSQNAVVCVIWNTNIITVH